VGNLLMLSAKEGVVWVELVVVEEEDDDGDARLLSLSSDVKADSSCKREVCSGGAFWGYVLSPGQKLSLVCGPIV
jgi:hypothetical protein